MFDPNLGRWMTLDPIGFEAGDTNLYRYVGNDPTNRTDPSGLLPPDAPFGSFGNERELIEAAKREKEANQFKIGGIFKCDVETDGFSATGNKPSEAVKSLYDAAERVHRAHHVLTNQWELLKEKRGKTTITYPGGKVVEFTNPSFKILEANRDLYVKRLAVVYEGLLKGNPRSIRLVDTNETHPDGNSMYTEEYRILWMDVSKRVIALRTDFWKLDRDKRKFWTCHEYARFYLRLDDNKDYADGHGVEEWDQILTYLEESFHVLNK